jgi:hypothetical protein
MGAPAKISEEWLRGCIEEGIPPSRIAQVMGVTHASITTKAHKLGLKLTHMRPVRNPYGRRGKPV